MRPSEFPLGSVESRAAARKLLQNRHSADYWKTITVKFDSIEEAKRLARLFRPRGNVGVRLIDDSGNDIPF
jgi:hypothetical protein